METAHKDKMKNDWEETRAKVLDIMKHEFLHMHGKNLFNVDNRQRSIYEMQRHAIDVAWAKSDLTMQTLEKLFYEIDWEHPYAE